VPRAAKDVRPGGARKASREHRYREHPSRGFGNGPRPRALESPLACAAAGCAKECLPHVFLMLAPQHAGFPLPHGKRDSEKSSSRGGLGSGTPTVAYVGPCAISEPMFQLECEEEESP